MPHGQNIPGLAEKSCRRSAWLSLRKSINLNFLSCDEKKKSKLQKALGGIILP